MTITKKSKEMCLGCSDDFYNDKNPYGVKECWGYRDAKIVLKKLVPMDMEPPWQMIPTKILSCYQKPGFARIDPERTC